MVQGDLAQRGHDSTGSSARRLSRSPRGRDGNSVPAHARSAVGLAHRSRLYHRGSPVQLDLGSDGTQPGEVTSLLVAPESPQQIVPPSVWQRARPMGDEPSLVSCTVTPGFDFEDFRLEDSHG